MGFLDVAKGLGKTLAGFIPGGSEIVKLVEKVIPDKMSEEEKVRLELEIEKSSTDRKIQLLDKWNEYDRQFQDFTKDMEGTAGDLKSIPVIGHIIILLRGAFRPLCCYSVLFTFIKVLSGSWNLDAMYTTNANQAWSLLWIITLLVFTFVFGERAIQNLMPLIERVMGLKYNNKNGSNNGSGNT